MSEWISVDDRFPEPKPKYVFDSGWIDVLSSVDGRRTDAFYFEGKFWTPVFDHQGDFDHDDELKNITHWMTPPANET